MTWLDRLARSVSDLHRLIEQIAASGSGFRCLQQGGVDTASSTGKLMLAILGAVAGFENDIRKERQRDGIEKAKVRGVYQGWPPRIDPTVIKTLRDSGAGPSRSPHRSASAGLAFIE